MSMVSNRTTSAMKDSQNIKTEPQVMDTSINKSTISDVNDENDDCRELVLLAGNETAWRTLVFDNFKRILDEMKILQTNPIQNKTAIKERYMKGLMFCGTIKKLNRVSNLTVNKARLRTQEEKNKIDEHHLELQNLLYEISHLKKEINTCLEFRSLHEDIHLIPLDEFYAQATSEISNPDVTRKDEHKLKLAQLDWELIERQNMLNRIKDLETQIESHERQLQLKQSKLESLNPKLNQILEACKPTMDYFNTNFDENCMFSEPVQFLPKPLYHFYMMMSAYRDIMDKDIKIEVIGDVEEAKRTNVNETVNTLDDDDSDSANEDEIENDYTSKKKKSKTKANNKKKSNYRDKLFNCFPLCCRVTFSVRGYGQFVLEFFYIIMLKIITMKSEIRLLKDIKFTENSIFRVETIFDSLYENDNGQESPNMANKFLFANIGLQSIEEYWKQIGMPYKWCQYLCGLYYDNREDREAMIYQSPKARSKISAACSNGNGATSADMDTDDETTLNSIDNHKQDSETKMFERIISRLKARFKSRICLQEVISQLKNSKLPLDTKFNKFQIQSSISEFKESDYEKYASLAYTRTFSSFNFINEANCMFYELQLQKAEAVLRAQIVIHQDYPKIVPLFSVSIHWKHERNCTNDEAIREIERNLNLWRDAYKQFNDENTNSNRVVPSSSNKSTAAANTPVDKTLDILARQIYQLLVYFDIYLEAESNYLCNGEIPVTKLFPNAVRGRDRQRPYSYLSVKNIFVQRMQQQNTDNKTN